MILVYVTYSSKEEAKKIIRQLLEDKLIACGNLFPAHSFYWWEGKIEEGSEFVSILKTKEELFERVSERIKEMHSYDTPCIIRIKADCDKKYLEWVTSSCC